MALHFVSSLMRIPFGKGTSNNKQRRLNQACFWWSNLHFARIWRKNGQGIFAFLQYISFIPTVDCGCDLLWPNKQDQSIDHYQSKMITWRPTFLCNIFIAGQSPAVSRPDQNKPKPKPLPHQPLPSSRYNELLRVIEELGKDVKPTYAGKQECWREIEKRWP